MPTISWFYGVSIRMYFGEHPPPHFHAVFGRDEAQVAIATGEVLRGRLPPKEKRRVKQWALIHQAELMANWNRIEAGDTTRPARILGLDEDDG